MAICYSGDLRKTDTVLAPLRALGDPVFDLRQNQPYTQLQSSLDATEPKGLHYYWRTHYASELSDGLLATAKDLAIENPIPAAEVAFLHLGGALCDRDGDDGAVGNRDARYASGAIGIWEPDDPNGAAYEQWIRDAGERFKPYSTGATYINFQTADESGQQIRATYGANFERVAAVKQQYDPQNVFRMNRNIAAAAAGARP
jgi:FAD/FMN-containing dehydrogenase